MSWFSQVSQDSIPPPPVAHYEAAAGNEMNSLPQSLPQFPTQPSYFKSYSVNVTCSPPGDDSDRDLQTMSYVTLQEQRCVLSWFLGWGTAQKQRFLEDLVAKAVPGKVCSLLGQLNTMQVKDHLPNIFECQLNLWTQWFDSWTEEERNAFIGRLEEKDPLFVSHFYNGVAGTAGCD